MPLSRGARFEQTRSRRNRSLGTIVGTTETRYHAQVKTHHSDGPLPSCW